MAEPNSNDPHWSVVDEGYVGADAKPLPQPTRSPVVPFAVRLLVFAGVFGFLQYQWEMVREGGVGWIVLHDCTVLPAVHLIQALTPAVHAWADRFTIRAPGGGLNILNGCEGTELLFLLLAALSAAPLTWRARFVGMLAGIPVVFVINQVRLLTLFYAYRTDHSLFDLLHSTVTPIGTVLLVAAYFYVWLNRFPATPAAA